MKRWMVDIESLGDQPGGVILSIGWVRFNLRDGPNIATAKERRISVQSCLDHGLVVDGSTAEWWFEQPGKPWRSDTIIVELPEALRDLAEDLAYADQIWAKPPSYDIAAIRHAMKMVGVKPTWSHSVEMCLRTLLRLVPSLVKDRGHLRQHGAVDDAIFQAMQCVYSLGRLPEKEGGV